MTKFKALVMSTTIAIPVIMTQMQDADAKVMVIVTTDQFAGGAGVISKVMAQLGSGAQT